jgi:hypothetical protein
VHHHHYVHYDDEAEQQDRRHHRRGSRRSAHSPESSVRYKVDNHKTTRLEPSPLANQYYDEYDEAPEPPKSGSGRKSRRHSNTDHRPASSGDGHTSAFQFFPHKIKTTKVYGPEDISFSHVQYTPIDPVWAA